MEEFLSNHMNEYKAIGFIGNDFSDNTLRWQLAVILFRMVRTLNFDNTNEIPKTGWGESAYIWCSEKLPEEANIFSYCGVDSRKGDSLYFFDYCNGKGDHHDFYGNERYVNIFCDICQGENLSFSEYDLEAIAEMVKKGYVIKEGDTYHAAVPIYTTAQYQAIINMVNKFIASELITIIKEMDTSAAEILGSHTPKHLQNQVEAIASMDKFANAVCIPASILIDRHFLNTAWNALEMPTTYTVLNQ